MTDKQTLQAQITQLKNVLASPKTDGSTRKILQNALNKAEAKMVELEKAQKLESSKKELTPKQKTHIKETKKETKSLAESLKEKVKKAKQKVVTTTPKATTKKGGTRSVAKAKQIAKEMRSKQAKQSTKDADIESDAQRFAINKVRRTSHGGRANQYGTKAQNKGGTYYEYRENRYDRQNKRYAKLEDGGMTQTKIEDGAKRMASNPNWTNEKLLAEYKSLSIDLEDLKEGKITPRKVIGGGYKSSAVAKRIAKQWLEDRIAEYKKALEIRGVMADGGKVVGYKMYYEPMKNIGGKSIQSDDEIRGNYKALDAVLDKKIGDDYYGSNFYINDGYGTIALKDDKNKEKVVSILKMFDFEDKTSNYVTSKMADGGILGYASGGSATSTNGGTTFSDGDLSGMFAHGGVVKWQDVNVGDSALVKETNKMGVIFSTYGRKFNLRFVDGSEKTYDASELEFFKDEEYARGGMTEHGLMIGDTIISTTNEPYSVVVRNNGKQAIVDLNEGTREEDSNFYAHGGQTRFQSSSGMKYEDKTINVGDFVMVDNPHWKGSTGVDKAVKRKVKMVYGDYPDGEVFFSDGSNSSLKYVKKLEDGGLLGYANGGSATSTNGGTTFSNGDLSGMFAKGGVVDIRTKYAKKDINTLMKEGNMSMYDTKHGVMHLSYEGGVFTIKNNKYNPSKEDYETIFKGGKDEATKFVADSYIVDEMAKGGMTSFNDKVKSISKRLLKDKKVSPKVQKDYGKTYNKKEALESAKRIAGALRKKEMAKKKR